MYSEILRWDSASSVLLSVQHSTSLFAPLPFERRRVQYPVMQQPILGGQAGSAPCEWHWAILTRHIAVTTGGHILAQRTRQQRAYECGQRLASSTCCDRAAGRPYKCKCAQ
eukprot:349632-Chlamydomonas_euryale.AAC.21